MGKPGGLQARGDFRVVCIAAVQPATGIGPQLMLLGPRAKLFIVHALSQLAGDSSACGSRDYLRARLLNASRCAERAEACINRDTVLLLERGER